MKTLIIAATAALISAPAFAIDANHFESPAEAAAYGQSFDASGVDTSVLYNSIDSVAEMNGFTGERASGFSTKNAPGIDLRALSVTSPAELAALKK